MFSQLIRGMEFCSDFCIFVEYNSGLYLYFGTWSSWQLKFTFLNYFCHCPVFIMDGTHAHEYTYNSFANSGFLDWQLWQPFSWAEILRILILTSRNFVWNALHVHSDDVNMNLRKLKSLLKYLIHTVIDRTADTSLSHTLCGIVHLKICVPIVVFSKWLCILLLPLWCIVTGKEG